MADDDVDWALVRIAYEGSGETVRALAERFGINRSTLSRRARREGWVMRQPEKAIGQKARLAGRRAPPSTAALVRALQRTTARLVMVTEARFAKAGEDVEEKDMRALGALAGTLSKVIALATAEKPERDRDPDGPPDDPDDPRPARLRRADSARPGRAGGNGGRPGRALDFEDPGLVDALCDRLERLTAERAVGAAPIAEPEREGELGALLADLRAGRPTGPAR